MRGLLRPGHLITNRTRSVLCFTTYFITDLHAQLEPFPAFLAIFRQKETVIISMGKIQLLFCALILKIVDTNYMNF